MDQLKVTVSVKWQKKARGLYARLRWTDPTTGKRCTEAVGYVNPAVAEAARAEKQASLRLGLRPSRRTTATVEEVLLLYLQDLVERAPRKRYMTEAYHARHLRAELGHMQANRVGTAHLRTYLARRRKQPGERRVKKKDGTFTVVPLSPPSRATVFHEVRVLRAAFKFARDTGTIDCEPPPAPSKKEVAKDARPQRRLTEADVAALLHHVGQGDAHRARLHITLPSLFTVLAWSGRRPVAVFALEVEDVDEENERVLWRRDKGGEGRGWSPVTAPAWRAILDRLDQLRHGALIAPTGRLWETQQGSSWSTVTLRRHMLRAAAAAGLDDVQVYDLRKYACTRILRACGGDIHLAAQFTGHKNAQTIYRYAYATEREAVEIAARVDWTPTPLRVVVDKR